MRRDRMFLYELGIVVWLCGRGRGGDKYGFIMRPSPRVLRIISLPFCCIADKSMQLVSV